MGLCEYKMLAEHDQWKELLESGIHIANRKYLNTKFSLNALHKLYVEVELSSKDKIIGKKVFKTGQTMDKYVGQLGI